MKRKSKRHWAASRKSRPDRAAAPARKAAGASPASFARRSFLQGLGAAALGWLLPSLSMAGKLGKPSWHLPDGSFKNNYIAAIDKSFSDLRKAFEPPKPPPISFPRAETDIKSLRANRSEPTVTWIGHCTLLVQMAGVNVITDPHFFDRASPVPFAGPKRTTPLDIDLEDLPEIDVVLISHNHYDHLDYRSIRTLRHLSPQASYFVPLQLKPWFKRAGVTNVVELDWWEQSALGSLKLTAVPSQHWSNRVLLDRNKTLWCGWAVEAPGFKFVFIGDTGYSRDFADIGERFGGFDLAAIPIGAYNPRWFMQDVHQNPEEAVQCMKDLNARRAVATHWGTFQLTLEDMDEPLHRLEKAVSDNGLDKEAFVAFKHCETRYLSEWLA